MCHHHSPSITDSESTLPRMLLLSQWSEHVVRGGDVVAPERPVVNPVVGRVKWAGVVGRVVERVEEAPGPDCPVPRVGHPHARPSVAGAAVHPGRVVLGVSQGLKEVTRLNIIVNTKYV